ncbi:RNA-directed DNA polymerase, eukaryota [Tanacetum coccineum]
MATEPNDARLTILMQLREEFDIEAALAKHMLNLMRRFANQIHSYTNGATSPIHPFGGENAVRIIPGHVGILQTVKLRKIIEIREGGHECVMSTHAYVRKIIEDASEDDHFTRGPWLSVIQYLDAEWGITSGCFGDIKTFCKNEKLENVVTLIKSCTSNALGELTVTLKDPSGTISCTFHHKVLTKGGYEKSITVELF